MSNLPMRSLKATIREYRTPTRDPFAHSITTDQNGNAWFSELSERGNKIDRFNLETEEFQEYTLALAAEQYMKEENRAFRTSHTEPWTRTVSCG